MLFDGSVDLTEQLCVHLCSYPEAADQFVGIPLNGNKAHLGFGHILEVPAVLLVDDIASSPGDVGNDAVPVNRVAALCEVEEDVALIAYDDR